MSDVKIEGISILCGSTETQKVTDNLTVRSASTVDRENFTIKNNSRNNFCGVKFSTDDDYNIDKWLENSKHFVYYQVLLAEHSCQSDIYPWSYVQAYSLIITT